MTHPDDRSTADARQARLLARFLDDLRDGAAVPPAGLDPDLAEMALVARDLVSPSPSTALTTTPTVRRAEKARTWEHLMSTHAPAGPIDWGSDPVSVPHPTTRPDADRRHREARLRLVRSAGAAQSPLATTGPATRTPPRRWRRHGWPLIELLSVAALLIGIVSVLIGGSGGGQNGDRPAVIPPLAGAGTATPEPGSDEVAALPDPGQTGVMPGPGPEGQPALLWRVPVERGDGTVVVGHDLVIRSLFPEDPLADEPGPATVQAFTVRAGTLAWETTVEGDFPQVAAVWRGTVIASTGSTQGQTPLRVGGETIGGVGESYVLGLDATDGTVLWSTVVADSDVPGAYVSGTTVTPDGVVYVSTSQGRVVRLDAWTGTPIWQTAVGGSPATVSSFQQAVSVAAVADDMVVVYSIADGKVHALDAATGQERWQREVSLPAQAEYGVDDIQESVSAPALSQGRVYLTTSRYYDPDGDGDQALLALDAATGDPLWTTDLDPIDLRSSERPYGVSGPSVADGAVILSTGSVGGLAAFDTDTGDPLWDVALGTGRFSLVSIAGDTAYAARDDGTLTAVDGATGAERWSVATGGQLAGRPFVVGGVVYLAGLDEQLYAIGGSGEAADASAATPADISGLAGCDVSPRPARATPEPGEQAVVPGPDEVGTPAATLAEPDYFDDLDDLGQPISQAPTLTWDDVPVGTPADANTVAAISETVDAITSCARTDDYDAVAALFSDDYFIRPYVLRATAYGNPLPSTEIPVMSGDVRLLDDGRAAMIVTDGLIQREIGQNEGRLYVFAEQPDGRWLIDEVIIVNDSGLAPMG